MNTSIKFVRYHFADRWDDYSKQKGISPIYKLIDWMIGNSFKGAKSSEIVNAMNKNTFRLLKEQKMSNGNCCKRYVFHRIEKSIK